MRKLFLAPLLLTVILDAAEPQVVPLWEGGAPGFENRRDEPEKAQDYWVRNIHQPSLTVFLPPKEKATGAAVVVCPGGGHRELVFNSEGVEAARFLNNIGVAALVLKYRLGRETGSPYNVETHARADGQRAIRLARSRAADWGIDPKRIGMMGFSAGGEVLAMVAYQATGGDVAATDPVDRISCRPNFLIAIYPGPGGTPKIVPADTAPAFFLAAIDDRGPANVIMDMVPKFRTAGVPVEVHLYARGGHAFNMGLRTKLVTLKGWPQRLADWMADNSILDPDPAHRAEK